MKIKLSLESLLSIALIIFFFMPWLKLAGGLVAYNGYEIPYTAKSLAVLFSTETYTDKLNVVPYLAYLLYLVPLLCGLTIYLDIFHKKTNRFLPLLAAAIPFAIFLVLLARLQLGAFDHLDIGLYLSVLIGVLILLDFFGLISMTDIISKGYR